ncbi:UDP-N-acetylglucosamine-1-phosphate transferase [Methanolobus chelungpuianus]|uniref:UDP-N-acetylglucosamine-1-phosphate transferase n=1 Tax=Methanolobus chelungpuianus TaxID=502115 RepID=A0AAE3HBA8_9EURY|nr:UDP-N-acetylglucosamine-1-phosphate transferase [Methanolobus chelungpuianus]
MLNTSFLSVIHAVILACCFLMPFTFTYISMPYFITKLTEKGILARDYYKLKITMVPERGGIAILLVAMVCFSLATLFFKFSTTNYVALIVVSLFGLFGILDDMVDIGRVTKLLLMYYCSYPLIQYATTTAFTFPTVGNFETGILYLQFVVPTFVLVASNLVNMHSGFNGLASGLSTIVLISLTIRSVIVGDIENIFALVCIAGATLAFFLYDRYPSKIFWGNVGSLTTGAAIGAFIIIQGFVISGFIMLIPHTINFLLYVYWRVMKFPVAKFGKTREDGTLEVPNPLTLKWVLPYYYRVTERQATYAMYIFTGFFCLLGILLPGRM